MLSEMETAALWRRACGHAGYDSVAETRLYVLPGAAIDDQCAIHLKPDSDATYEERFPLQPAQLRDANSAAERRLHRVVVRGVTSPRVLLALLRHELEHARQYDVSRRAYEFMGVAQSILGTAFHQGELPTMKGSAGVYNFLPHERDANRAAADLASAEFGPPSDADLLGGHGNLFRDTGPFDPITLPRRLLVACALFPRAFESVCAERGRASSQVVAGLDLNSGSWWRRLTEDERISEYGQLALAAAPSQAEADAATPPAAAWSRAITHLHEGQQVAESMLRP